MKFIIEYILSTNYNDTPKCETDKDLLSFYETYFHYTFSFFSLITARHAFNFFSNLWVGGIAKNAISNGEFLAKIAETLEYEESDDTSSDLGSESSESSESICDIDSDIEAEITQSIANLSALS